MIVLQERRADSGLGKFVGLPGFHEESARIAEHLRFDERHAVNGSIDELHAGPVMAAFLP